MRYKDTLFYDDYSPLTPPSIGPFTKEEDLHGQEYIHRICNGVLSSRNGNGNQHCELNPHETGEIDHVTGTQEGKESGHAVAKESACTPQPQGTSAEETP